MILPLAVWLATVAVLVGTWIFGGVPFMAAHGGEIVVWAYVLAFLAGVWLDPVIGDRDDRLDAAGLREPRVSDMTAFAASCALVLLPYGLLFVAAGSWWMGKPADWGAWRGIDFGPLLLSHLFGAALPEELLYRGYIQSSLDRRLGRPWRVFGADIGWGLVAASAMFALPHIFFQPPIMLTTFFPGLLFGWLRNRTGALWAPVALHAVSNVELAYLLKVTGLSGS